MNKRLTIAFFEREDQMAASAPLRSALEAEGYQTRVYNDGALALEELHKAPPALLVLEIKVPGIDGLELLRRLRQKIDFPVIFLTTKHEEIDQLFALKMGADAYITKPYSERVVAEQLKALLRRWNPNAPTDAPPALIELGKLWLDPERHTCKWDGRALALTATEFLLLKELATRPGVVKTHHALRDAAYDDQVHVDDRTIDSQIKRLRKKFKAVDNDFDVIETLKGVGYRFAEQPILTAADSDRTMLGELPSLKQSPLGATFQVLNDQLVIAPSGHATDDVVARSALVQTLHKEVRRKALAFVPTARRLNNQLGWLGTGAALDRLLGHIGGDTTLVADRIGDVWCAVVELGSYLELDQQLQSSPQSAASALDPEVRRQFVDLVRTASPFVRQFPTARELDDQSGAFLARKQLLQPANEVVREAANANLVPATDRKFFEALVAAAERGDFQGTKADSRVCNSARNLVIAGVGLVASFYAGSTLQYHSGISPISKRAGDAMIAAEKPILKLFEDAPDDLRRALGALVERLKQDREMPEAKSTALMPTPPRQKRAKPDSL